MTKEKTKKQCLDEGRYWDKKKKQCDGLADGTLLKIALVGMILLAITPLLALMLAVYNIVYYDYITWGAFIMAIIMIWFSVCVWEIRDKRKG